jgi:hypothetical protein
MAFCRDLNLISYSLFTETLIQWHLMDRRQFIKQIGLGLAASWAAGRLSWPLAAQAGESGLRLALLADAHLKDGHEMRPEVKALARAVAEIKALSPPPDLVLLAGDLAHKGRPDALDLGREILSDLPAPLWAVRGEGDHGPNGSAWGRRFGEPNFSRAYRDCRIIGLDTVLSSTSRGPAFEVGAAQRQWLAQELAALDPATPLVIFSHAPLARLFYPWRQWTGDAPEIAPLLSGFRRVVGLHGHMHVAEGGGQEAEVVNFAENHKTPTHISLPATSWSLPLAVQGTPAHLRPGLRPHGCGWALVTLSPTSWHFRSYLWQA